KLARFEANATVEAEALGARGVVGGKDSRIKVLAAGRLRSPLHLRVHRISKAARAAVEAAGGSVELLEAEHEKSAAKPRRKTSKPSADESEESEQPPAAAQTEAPAEESAEEQPE